MPKKIRPKIPQETIDRLLVSCRHRCCICENFGVEIHHIDGDPTNNREDNLIPLCGNCAKQVHVIFPPATRIHGISQQQLKLYKANWIEKCNSSPSTIVANQNELKETLSEIKGEILKLREERR